MITHSHARNMAEAKWGRGGTNSERTNRKGAFYFSCSGHGGFVIDARCLTQDEYRMMRKFLTPEIAHEVYGLKDGETRRLRGPDSRRNLKYYSSREAVREIEIFFAEEDCDWSVPGVVAGILAGDTAIEKARASFLRWKNPSNHDRLALGLVEDQLC